jgi:3-dehydroquinate synthase
MDVLRQEIHVSFRYPVAFTRGVFDASNPLLRSLLIGHPDPMPARALVVVDDGVVRATPDLIDRIERYGRHHTDVLDLVSPVLVLAGGETVKNDASHLAGVHRAIQAAGLCRHSYLIAVGGGAVLDVAGYAAATAHRGIRLIRVPTTVLAQDDSAVGVKNGINGFGKKNYFGTFAPPFAVINDLAFLSTLGNRDWFAGISEAVKVALVRDPALFDYIERHSSDLVARDGAVMEQLVRRSAALHCAHITEGGDPFELGTSRPLDFGHWSAHKLEQLTNGRLRHGEAVSIGLALDCTYACLCGFLSDATWRRVLDLLVAVRLPIYAPELDQGLDAGDGRSVMQGLAEFREHLGGRLTIMLIRGIGEPFDVHEVESDAMRRSIAVLRSFDEAGSAGVTLDAATASTLTRGLS